VKPWEQPTEYWQAKQELVKYMRDITREFQSTTKGQIVWKYVVDTLSAMRSLKTGLDFSAAGRQGISYIGTKEWRQAFRNMFRYAKDPVAFDSLEVQMMRSKYSEQAMKYKSELGLTMLGEKLTQREEQFGAKLVEKIPFLRGSERAYVGFLNELRFNRFTNIVKNLDEAGTDILSNTKTLRELAQVIGSATGRGQLPRGVSAPLSTVLFSPRWLKSRFDILLNPITKTGPARVEAAKSLGRVLGVTVSIAGLAKASGMDVEFDPRSSDFLKVKVGNTRFDFSGGLAPIITLLSRLGTLSTKSSSTDKVNSLTSGAYGAQSGMDVLVNFFTNRTSPVAGVVRDILRGRDFEGNDVKLDDPDFIKYLAHQLLTPLLVSDVWDAFQDSSDGMAGILSIPASLFGVGVSTQAPKQQKQYLKLP
jgi:hypothetical protein